MKLIVTISLFVRDLFLTLFMVQYLTFSREKKWVNVGPSSCTLKIYKWVPGEKRASRIIEAYINRGCQTVACQVHDCYRKSIWCT